MCIRDRADIYSVGVTLFLMLAGRYPFANTTLHGMVVNHLAPVPDLRDIDPTIPAELAALVSRCLARNPAERPSAAELASALAAYADEHEPRALDVLIRDNAIGGLSDA